MKKNQAVLALFDGQVDDPGITVSAYVATYAPRVRVVDLEEAVPAVFGSQLSQLG